MCPLQLPADAGIATAQLRGPDHPWLGAVAVCRVRSGSPYGLAGATSAGARPKDSPSIEANEDGVLLAYAPGVTVMLVVDGAGGFRAADAVMNAVKARLGRLVARVADGDVDREARSVWSVAMTARDGARSTVGSQLRRPHVAASLVIVHADRVWCATVGDTAVVRLGRGEMALLSGVAPHLDHTAPLPLPQRTDIYPGDCLVGMTDGIVDALRSRWPEVLRLATVAHPVRGDHLAEVLVRAALDAGGDDHATAAVHRH